MTEFDPTTNCIPLGLLSHGEQLALQEWPHGWEFYGPAGWSVAPCPYWENHSTYRGKPEPFVTSVWQNIYVRGACESRYRSRESADKHSGGRIGVLRIDTCDGVSTPHLEVG